MKLCLGVASCVTWDTCRQAAVSEGEGGGVVGRCYDWGRSPGRKGEHSQLTSWGHQGCKWVESTTMREYQSTTCTESTDGRWSFHTHTSNRWSAGSGGILGEGGEGRGEGRGGRGGRREGREVEKRRNEAKLAQLPELYTNEV